MTKVIDCTENRVTPCALKRAKAFQGRWWEYKEFWREERSKFITRKLGGLLKKG